MNTSAVPVLPWNDEALSVGINSMDNTHKEFIELLNQCASATTEAFPALFNDLLQHTQQHFQNENRIMEESGFPPTIIHQGEHTRILAELEPLSIQAKPGDISPAQRYISEYIPGWFCNHAATMDSALAWHLKSQGMEDSF